MNNMGTIMYEYTILNIRYKWNVFNKATLLFEITSSTPLRNILSIYHCGILFSFITVCMNAHNPKSRKTIFRPYKYWFRPVIVEPTTLQLKNPIACHCAITIVNCLFRKVFSSSVTDEMLDVYGSIVIVLIMYLRIVCMQS